MFNLAAFRERSPLQQIAWMEPFWLLGLAPFLLLSDRLIAPTAMPLAMPLVVALFFVGWPLRRLAYGRFSARTPLDGPLAVLLLWMPVGWWVAADRLLAWQAIGYLAFGIALYAAIVNWPPARRRPARALLFFLPVMVGLALIGPILLSSTPVKIFRLPEFQLPFEALAASFGESVNPNVLAGALLLGVPLLTALALGPGWTPQPGLRLGCGVLALFLLILVVLTQSRGAYGGAAVGLLMVLGWRWPRLGYVLLSLLLLGGGLLLAQPGILQVLSGEIPFLVRLDERAEIWSRAWFALIDFPLTGIGLGNYGVTVPIFYPFRHLVAGGLPHAHNLLLQVGVDLGGPGLVAYLALLIGVIFGLLRVQQRADPLRQVLAVGILASLAAMLIHGITDAVTWGTKLSFLPWILYAQAVLLGRKIKNEE